MKNALLIAALALAATPAMASKARLSSLNSAMHLNDIQDVFTNPAKATTTGDWLTFEMGATPGTNTAAEANPRAEGGFSRSMDSARWGFYMGHQYSMITELRAASHTASAFEAAPIAPDNMINLFYGSKAGEMAWGLGLGYSKTDKKTTSVKQDALALSGGVLFGAWDISATLGLMNNYKDEAAATANTRDFKGTMGANIDATYAVDAMTYGFGYGMNGAKTENGSGTELAKFDWNNWYVGAERSNKMEGADFFYGVKYTMLTRKNKTADTKLETSKLPVYAGIEADAASWLVLRGSVTQNFVLGTTQGPAANAEKDSIANDTTVAAGAGLKFGKLTIDGTLSAASAATANLDGGSLLANGSITYMF